MNRNEKLDKLSRLYESVKLNDKQYTMLSCFAADEDSDIRTQVVYALKNVVNEKSREILFLLASDKDLTVRFEAVSALENYKDEITKEFLEKLLRNEKSDVVFCAAAVSWSEICVSLNNFNPSLIEKVFIKVGESEYISMCRHFAEYRLGDDSALEKIISFLNSGDSAISCTALSLLDKLKNNDNLSKIKKSVRQSEQSESMPAFKIKCEKILNA